MKKIALLTVMLAGIAIPMIAQGHCGGCANKELSQKEAVKIETQLIPSAKKAHWIDENYYVEYQWNKKPKIGTFLLQFNVFDKNKTRVTNLDITADAFMPSMKGSHDTGDRPMKLNKKGEYVVPVYFMMLGDWEILLKIKDGDKNLANVSINLDI
jgi:hypothetical protein